MGELTYIENILSDPQVQTLCLHALQDENRLEEAIRAIYRLGFVNTPDIENADYLFAQRYNQIRQEYLRQRDAYHTGPDVWMQTHLEIAENPVHFSCAVCLMAAALHAVQWQQNIFSASLEQRIKAPQKISEQDLSLLQQCGRMDLTGLFPAGYVPRKKNIQDPTSEEVPQPGIPIAALVSAAGILSMASYVAAKRCAFRDLPADISFDAVCLLSNAMVDILWGKQFSSQAVAVIGAVLAVQYMHVPSWPVIRRCALAIPVLNRKIIGALTKPVLEMTRQSCSELWEIRRIIQRFHREDVSQWIMQWHNRYHEVGMSHQKQEEHEQTKVHKKEHEYS